MFVSISSRLETRVEESGELNWEFTWYARRKSLKYSRIWLNYNFIIFSFFSSAVCSIKQRRQHLQHLQHLILRVQLPFSSWLLLGSWKLVVIVVGKSQQQQLVKDFFSPLLQKIHSHSIIFSSSSSFSLSSRCVSSIFHPKSFFFALSQKLQPIIPICRCTHSPLVVVSTPANLIIINLCLSQATAHRVHDMHDQSECELHEIDESSRGKALIIVCRSLTTIWHSICERFVVIDRLCVWLLFIRFRASNNNVKRSTKSTKIYLYEMKEAAKVVVAGRLYQKRLRGLWMLLASSSTRSPTELRGRSKK